MIFLLFLWWLAIWLLCCRALVLTWIRFLWCGISSLIFFLLIFSLVQCFIHDLHLLLLHVLKLFSVIKESCVVARAVPNTNCQEQSDKYWVDYHRVETYQCNHMADGEKCQMISHEHNRSFFRTGFSHFIVSPWDSVWVEVGI